MPVCERACVCAHACAPAAVRAEPEGGHLGCGCGRAMAGFQAERQLAGAELWEMKPRDSSCGLCSCVWGEGHDGTGVADLQVRGDKGWAGLRAPGPSGLGYGDHREEAGWGEASTQCAENWEDLRPEEQEGWRNTGDEGDSSGSCPACCTPPCPSGPFLSPSAPTHLPAAPFACTSPVSCMLIFLIPCGQDPAGHAC